LFPRRLGSGTHDSCKTREEKRREEKRRGEKRRGKQRIEERSAEQRKKTEEATLLTRNIRRGKILKWPPHRSADCESPEV